MLPNYSQSSITHCYLTAIMERDLLLTYKQWLVSLYCNMFSQFCKGLFRTSFLLVPTTMFLAKAPYFAAGKDNDNINMKLKNKLEKLHHHNTQLAKEVSDHFRQNVVVISGNSNRALAEEISRLLGIELADSKIGRFADGEVSIEIKENVRAKNAYIIQSTCPPVNENLVELLLMVSTLRRASVKKIVVVVPYYGYARQDRKTAPRVPISAADVARLLQTVGVDRVVLVDVHSGQIQGFFGPRVPVDNLEAQLVALNYFVEQNKYPMRDIVVVSPDAGGVARAKNFLGMIRGVGVQNLSLAMIIKQRQGAGKIGSMHLVGNVQNKHAIIIDDIIDTAGTLCEASKVLKEEGALSVRAFATHGLFSGNAFNNIKSSQIDEIIVTNTIPPQAGEEELSDKIVRLSVAPILAEAIYRIHSRTSISSLFALPKV